MSKKLALLIIIQILLIFGPKNDLLSKLTAVIGVSTPPGGWQRAIMVIGSKFEQLLSFDPTHPKFVVD